MRSPKKYKRIVVKVGSSLFSKNTDKLDTGLTDKIARQVQALVGQGKEVVLVSSGAIALGMSILKLKQRPRRLEELQAAAAIGQHELMHVYKLALAKFKLNCAQLLLTWDDFLGIRYHNAKHTLNTLLKLHCVPIINENDSVATEEIKLGDNDRLSALVAMLVEADLLIILSDVAGLLDKNNQIIRRVEKITGEIKALACPTNKKTCVGGMVTKIEAARIAVEAGVPCVIADGKQKDIIALLSKDPFSQGTIFLPR